MDPMVKATESKYTRIRMERDTHDRVRKLARAVGVSQMKLLRALSFATRDDYLEFERRRIATDES